MGNYSIVTGLGVEMRVVNSTELHQRPAKPFALFERGMN
jgi:hypothetical protein